MKKMNNKGFAISTMLYGLLIIIVLVIAMILNIMAFNRKNSKEFTSAIVDELEKPVPKLCRRAATDTLEGEGNNIFGNENITLGVLTSGDAFDCDINGDGLYDSTTERFYYLIDLISSKSGDDFVFDNDYAVLIFNSNVSSGAREILGKSSYNDTVSTLQNNYTFPATAISHLPASTSNTWKNIYASTDYKELRKNVGATIRDEKYESKIPASGAYSNYNARLLRYEEVIQACSISTNSMGSLLSKCKFLLIKTYYGNVTFPEGYWLENLFADSDDKAWGISGVYQALSAKTMTITDQYGVRPVIEVSKSDISY